MVSTKIHQNYTYQSKSNVAVMWTIDGSSTYNKVAKLFDKQVMDSTVWESVDKGHTNIDVDTGIGIDVSKDTNSSTCLDDENTWDIVQKVTRDEDNAIRIMGVDTLRPHDAHSHSLLEWHIRLGHLSIKHIQALAEIGKLPKVLAKCKVPLCTGVSLVD
jgi:hypothetical protein